MLTMGRICEGHVSVGDQVDFLGHKLIPQKTAVSRVAIGGVQQKTGMPGEEVTVLLKQGADCERGGVLVKSGVNKVARQFEADVDFFELDEGGKKLPIRTGYRLQVIFPL